MLCLQLPSACAYAAAALVPQPAAAAKRERSSNPSRSARALRANVGADAPLPCAPGLRLGALGCKRRRLRRSGPQPRAPWQRRHHCIAAGRQRRRRRRVARPAGAHGGGRGRGGGGRGSRGRRWSAAGVQHGAHHSPGAAQPDGLRPTGRAIFNKAFGVLPYLALHVSTRPQNLVCLGAGGEGTARLLPKRGHQRGLRSPASRGCSVVDGLRLGPAPAQWPAKLRPTAAAGRPALPAAGNSDRCARGLASVALRTPCSCPKQTEVMTG